MTTWWVAEHGKRVHSVFLVVATDVGGGFSIGSWTRICHGNSWLMDVVCLLGVCWSPLFLILRNSNPC
ncbi:MAG: hypothetical protein R2788_22640 [Saprospiraceae bacterium]